MCKHILGLMLVMLCIAISVIAETGPDGAARVPKGFFSGNDWLGLNKTEQATYAMGVVVGLDLAATLKPQGLYWINPCVAGMTSDQVRAMLKVELDASPGERHLPMVHQAMYQALRKACPESSKP